MLERLTPQEQALLARLQQMSGDELAARQRKAENVDFPSFSH